MNNFTSFEQVYLVLAFIVPGVITIYVRSQFITGRTPTASTSLLNYFVVTIVYYALTFPLIELAISIENDEFKRIAAWISLILVGPAIFGLLLGLNIQKDWLHRFLRWQGLNPVHVMPTAWDWKFSRIPCEWVLVTLKDGTQFGGFCGPASFMSSDPNDRDLYIQWVYDIDDKNEWTPRGETGVLISAGEIQTIEFWPYRTEENSNGKEQ